MLNNAQKAASGGTQALQTITHPYGIAEQAISKEAYEAVNQVNNGATLYRIGTLGRSQAAEGQFWSLENPAKFLSKPEEFAAKFGMPAENLKSGQLFIEAGKLQKGASFVTRPAPAVGVNKGGSIEVVTNPGSVKLETFNVIKQQ